MLNMAVRNSKKLIREKSASDNIRIGRFFTKRETARLMADTFRPVERSAVYVLDPGAGTGILSAAAVEAICKMGRASEIFLTCYENDPMFVPMLANNLERIRRRARHDYHVKLRVDIKEENFLLASHPVDTRYDYIIINPPSEPCPNTREEAQRYGDIVASATVDTACLFVRAASDLLAPDGQMATVLPLSVATGVSLSRFRQRLFAVAQVEKICLFAKDKEGTPLKNQLVLALRAGSGTDKDLTITVSTDDGTPEKTAALPAQPYGQIVDPADGSLLLVKSEEELALLSFMRRLPCTLDTFHLRVHTGLALESRYPELLRDKPVDGAVPLIHPRSLRGGIVQFPLSGLKNQYIIPSIPSLCQPNKNMLLMKRVPAKSDKRRLVCAAYLAGSMTNKYISTHNKLNYIDVDGNAQMDPAFLFGLLAFLSSELVDSYIRIISKSGQVNATELASLPLPTANQLRTVGQKLMAIRIYKPEYCDRVVKAELLRTPQK